MAITDMTLSAYMDGELDMKARADVEAALAQSQELRDRLDAMRRMDSAVAGYWNTVNDRPLPEGVLAMLARESQAGPAPEDRGPGGDDTVVAFRRPDQPEPSRAPSFFRPAIAAGIALAVGIAMGAALGLGGSGDRALQALIAVGQSIGPGDPLYPVLQEGRSGEGVALTAPGTTAAPALSFESVDGALCREVSVRSRTAGARALACREAEGWRLRLLAAAPGSAGGYRPAAGAGAFEAAVDGMMAGSPFDAEEEAAQIAAGWPAER